MTTAGARRIQGFAIWARTPGAVYVGFLLPVASLALVAGLLPIKPDTANNIRWAALAIGTLPLTVAALLVAARARESHNMGRSPLARLVVWAGRLVWTSATFGLGAFVATIVGSDLKDVTSPVRANDYLCRLLALIAVTTGLFALLAVVAAAGWRFYVTSESAKCRALLRSLSTRAMRNALPLRTRMWLEANEPEEMPKLASHPTLDGTIRAVSSDTGRLIIPGGVTVFLIAASTFYPAVIQLFA